MKTKPKIKVSVKRSTRYLIEVDGNKLEDECEYGPSVLGSDNAEYELKSSVEHYIP
jgi:hypothetical protein